MEGIKIPRNVLNEKTKYPIDFIISFNVEIRQLPYAIAGGSLGSFILLCSRYPFILRSTFATIMFSIFIFLSNVKIQGEYLENNVLSFCNYIKFKYLRGKI